MGLIFTLSKSDYATRAEARTEARRKFPAYAVAAVSSKSADEWEILVEDRAPLPLRKKAEKPFPLKSLGDDTEEAPDDEEPSAKKPPKDDDDSGEELPGEDAEVDPMAKAKELVTLLEKVVPKLKEVVGLPDGPEGLPGEEPGLGPPGPPHAGPPKPPMGDGPPGPPGGAPKAPAGMPGGPAESFPTPPPGMPGARGPGRPKGTRPTPPIPVFTHENRVFTSVPRTRIVEVHESLVEGLTQDEIIERAAAEFPEYDVVEFGKNGKRFVAKLLSRETSESGDSA